MGAELQTATLSSPFSTQAPEPLPVESQVLAQPSNDVQSPALLPLVLLGNFSFYLKT